MPGRSATGRGVRLLRHRRGADQRREVRPRQRGLRAPLNRGRRLRLQIRDDGVGGAHPSTGSGLRGLRDRVDALDGRLELDSPPGGGTTVTVEIPRRAPLFPGSGDREDGREVASPRRTSSLPRRPTRRRRPRSRRSRARARPLADPVERLAQDREVGVVGREAVAARRPARAGVARLVHPHAALGRHAVDVGVRAGSRTRWRVGGVDREREAEVRRQAGGDVVHDSPASSER